MKSTCTSSDYGVLNVEKSEKKSLTITSKPHAHPHTMKKTYAKFHNNLYKIVRGVALTRGTNSLYIMCEKWILNMEKSNKKRSNNYIQTTCTSSYHEKNICKVSKWSVQNCKRSWAHKRYPLSIYWGWKMTKFTMWKKQQKMFLQLYPNHMHILIPWRKHKQSFKTIGIWL